MTYRSGWILGFAIVLTAGAGNPGRVVEELVKFRGAVVRTNLEAGREQQLRDAVDRGAVD